MTRVEYDGDNPLQLANEIEAALTKYGLGSLLISEPMAWIPLRSDLTLPIVMM
jgi:hypothetical protein